VLCAQIVIVTRTLSFVQHFVKNPETLIDFANFSFLNFERFQNSQQRGRFFGVKSASISQTRGDNVKCIELFAKRKIVARESVDLIEERFTEFCNVGLGVYCCLFVVQSTRALTEPQVTTFRNNVLQLVKRL